MMNKYKVKTDRMNDIEEAMFEAKRFLERADKARHNIKNNGLQADMKRSSMDLSKSLIKLRKIYVDV